MSSGSEGFVFVKVLIPEDEGRCRRMLQDFVVVGVLALMMSSSLGSSSPRTRVALSEDEAILLVFILGSPAPRTSSWMGS